jgi:hypothetical protein
VILEQEKLKPATGKKCQGMSLQHENACHVVTPFSPITLSADKIQSENHISHQGKRSKKERRPAKDNFHIEEHTYSMKCAEYDVDRNTVYFV